MSDAAAMRTIEIDGAEIAYIDSGRRGDGAATLVLLHGFPLSHAMWRGVSRELGPTVRVVAPDLRGYGVSTSGGWPVAGEAPSLDRYADDVAALIDSVRGGGPVVLAGFSMGGYVALNLARRRSEAFDAFALLDTRAIADTEDARATRLKMADKVAEWGAGRVAELMRPNLFGAGAPEAVVAETVGVIAATEPATIAASQRAMASRPDSTPLLPTIGKPTLVVVGAEDAISPPAEMRSIAGAIPGARFVEVAGAGHMAPVEQPAVVAEALRGFVAGL